MITFGIDNDGMNTAPFLIKTIENDENVVKFIIAFPSRGQKETATNETEIPTIDELLLETTPIYPDENNLYEIVFENYVFHMTRNESFTCVDNQEIQKGKYFIIFEQSKLLNYLPQIIELGLLEAYFQNGLKHYGIYCQNHIVDVIAAEPPTIKKTTNFKAETAQEVHLCSIFSKRKKQNPD